jgi:CheY-like chemotaxis protein
MRIPPSQRRLLEVLYIDDGENDLILTQLACERYHAPFKFVLARSVNEALDHLTETVAKPGALPDLILLDLIIGARSGFEVLEFLRVRPELAEVPVIIFTGMQNPALLARAQELGAKCVVAKTGGLSFAEKLMQAAQQLGL